MNKLLLISLSLVLSAGSYAQKAVYEHRTIMSDSVNSSQDESAAVLSADGKTLYFVRSFYSGNVGGVNGMQDIYFSRNLGDGKWTGAKNLGAPLNDEFHNAVCGVSQDGNRIYLNSIKIRQDKTDPGISVSDFQNGQWSQPRKISNFKFPEKGFFQVFVSYDEDTAIASFEGVDSKGLEDLYIMSKDPATGMFGDPRHLGDAINTSGFETSPVLSADGKTMYFSSNGLGGSGDADIFQSKRLDDSWMTWSAPENLGSRINTTGFDGSFSADSEGNAYYISGEGNSGLGDLYVISMIQPPPPPPPAPVVDTVPPPPPVVAAPPVPKRTDTLGQALFEFNSVIINPDSKASLNNVVTRLKQNESYRIQVEGHTDNKGSEKYNQRLSERRALAVKKFLIKNGISRNIIETRGFGELNPMADNSTEEGQALNRRVEVKYYMK